MYNKPLNGEINESKAFSLLFSLNERAYVCVCERERGRKCVGDSTPQQVYMNITMNILHDGNKFLSFDYIIG